MVFKSDKQRKGFFGSRGNVRSQSTPEIMRFDKQRFTVKDLQDIQATRQVVSGEELKDIVEQGSGKKPKTVKEAFNILKKEGAIEVRKLK